MIHDPKHTPGCLVCGVCLYVVDGAQGFTPSVPGGVERVSSLDQHGLPLGVNPYTRQKIFTKPPVFKSHRFVGSLKSIATSQI